MRSLLALLLMASPAWAGLHYSGEPLRPLPAQWSGFLLDHRALRLVGNPKFGTDIPSPPLRDTYADAALKLEAAAKSRPLTADESADLGALYVRLGKPERAVEILRPAARAHPDHFRTAANLGTAWQLLGDLEQASAALADAVKLAPESLRPAEELHLKLVRARLKEPKGSDGLDDLFGTTFASTDKPKLPADALANVQRLAIWLPSDGRLLWQLGEIANAAGDVRTAANVLDGCVTEFGLKSTELRSRRQNYRAAADALEKAGKHSAGSTAFPSTRPLVRAFDPSRLPKIDPTGTNRLPWPAITETELDRRLKPTFLDHVDKLDGKRVSVAGYMTPSAGRGEGLTGFLLTEFPVGCWFCESPGPTQLVLVETADGKEVDFVRGLIQVTGQLKLNRTDPERYPFVLVDAVVRGAD